MRTKTLLTAIAALAAGMAINSSAQVYSANVVGYANVALQGGAYNMLAVPFQVGASNGANEVFNGNYAADSGYLPDGTLLLKWDGATSSYIGYTYDTSVGADDNNWYNGDETAVSDTPVISVGEGFFVLPNGTWNWTNSLPAN